MFSLHSFLDVPLASRPPDPIVKIASSVSPAIRSSVSISESDARSALSAQKWRYDRACTFIIPSWTHFRCWSFDIKNIAPDITPKPRLPSSSVVFTSNSYSGRNEFFANLRRDTVFIFETVSHYFLDRSRYKTIKRAGNRVTQDAQIFGWDNKTSRARRRAAM